MTLCQAAACAAVLTWSDRFLARCRHLTVEAMRKPRSCSPASFRDGSEVDCERLPRLIRGQRRAPAPRRGVPRGGGRREVRGGAGGGRGRGGRRLRPRARHRRRLGGRLGRPLSGPLHALLMSRPGGKWRKCNRRPRSLGPAGWSAALYVRATCHFYKNSMPSYKE